MIVLSAQQSRAMQVTGFGAAIPSIVPVFAGTIDRVQQLSMSLASRAFGSKGHKTNIRDIRVSTKDYVSGIVGVAITIAGTWLLISYRKQLEWSEIAFMPGWLSVTMVVGAAVTFIGTMVYFWRKANV